MSFDKIHIFEPDGHADVKIYVCVLCTTHYVVTEKDAAGKHIIPYNVIPMLDENGDTIYHCGTCPQPSKRA